MTTGATPPSTVDMSVDLAGVRLPNPMMTASGCAANGREMHRFVDVAELGEERDGFAWVTYER